MPLQVTVRQNGGIFWLTGTVCGQRIRESTGTNDRALAEEKRIAREAEIFRADLHGVRASHTFAEAALSYLKRQRSADTKRRLNRFLGFLRETKRESLKCDQINQDLLDQACDVLLRPGGADSTRLREVISPVKTVLRHAAIRGWCAVPIFETIRQGKRRKDWLTPSEAEAIISASPPHLASMFEFMFCTGARRGEVLGLDWEICAGAIQPGDLARREGALG